MKQSRPLSEGWEANHAETNDAGIQHSSFWVTVPLSDGSYGSSLFSIYRLLLWIGIQLIYPRQL